MPMTAGEPRMLDAKELREELVITHDPDCSHYAILVGRQRAEVGPFFRLKDAVHAADPDRSRLWEDPGELAHTGLINGSLHPYAILISRVTRPN